MRSDRILSIACVSVLLFAMSSVGAQEDRLARAFLGINYISARIPYPKDQKYGYLAIAKFKDGTFAGYVKLTAPVENLKLAGQPKYETELGWALKDGSVRFILVTPAGTQGAYDDFFDKMRMGRSLALDRLPDKKLGPYYVLGFAAGGNGKDVDPADSESVASYIRNDWQVVVFLMCWFETEKEALDFSKKPPVLTAK